MGFAGDLIVLHDTETEGQPVVTEIAPFLDSKGLELNASQSKDATYIVRKKKLISRSIPFLKIGQIDIPTVSAISTFKYFGDQYV